MNKIQERKRNLRTEKAHKREVFWQITFPVIICVVLVLTLAVLAVVAATSGGSVKQAADASLIFLIIPLMIVTIIFTVIVGALAYGVIKINETLPFYARRTQDALERVSQQVQIGSDKAVEPVLKIRSFFASMGALKRK